MSTGPVTALSVRTEEIARLVYMGFTNGSIGRRFNVSAETVRNFCRNHGISRTEGRGVPKPKVNHVDPFDRVRRKFTDVPKSELARETSWERQQPPCPNVAAIHDPWEGRVAP
jgi:hypothetical protein